MPKLIILEGADRVGKTTISWKLSQAMGYPLKHFTRPDKDSPFSQYHFLFQQPGNYVLDRSWVSGTFYHYVRAKQATPLQKAIAFHEALTLNSYDIAVYLIDRPAQKTIPYHVKEIATGETDCTLVQSLMELRLWRSFALSPVTKKFNIKPILNRETDETVELIRNGRSNIQHPLSFYRQTTNLIDPLLWIEQIRFDP